MTASKVVDAILSRDVYTVNNSGSGSVYGWTRVKVEKFSSTASVAAGSNFAAQLYRSDDGLYKISFRGTESLLGEGDVRANVGGVVANVWPAELTRGAEFVYAAIREIQKREGGTFEQSAARLSLTGHSQGGWESKVHTKLFNLIGTAFDSPGAYAIVQTPEYRQQLERLQQLAPDYANFDAPLKGFTERQYTFIVGGVGRDIPGTVSDRSFLFLSAALLTSRALGLTASAVTQALIHRIDNIVNVERARETSPFLYRIAEDGSNQNALAVALSEPWARVMAGGAEQPSADAIAELMSNFLAAHRGSEVKVRQADGTLLIETARGDTLLLKPDGSGSSISVNGIAATEVTYRAGGVPLMSLQTQGDDDGNLMVQVTQAGQRNIFVIGPDGRSSGTMIQYLDEHGVVVSTGYEPPMRSLEIDYMVGPRGEIISSAGERMPKRDSNGPTIMVNEWGDWRVWDGGYHDGPGYGWVNDSWLPRGDVAYTGVAGDNDAGLLDPAVAEAFARIIQSSSSFQAAQAATAAQAEDARRRIPFEPQQDLQPPPPAVRPDRRRGGSWGWEP